MRRSFDQLARGLSSLALQGGSSTGQASSGDVTVSSRSQWVKSSYHGVEISTFQMEGFPDVSYAIVEHEGVIGSSLAQVQHVVDTAQGGPNISSSAAYKDAIASVPSSKGSVWVDIQGIVTLIRQSLPPGDQAGFDLRVMPNLAPLKALVVGSEGDASHARVRVFLKIG